MLALALCLVAAAIPAHAFPVYDPYNQETIQCMADCGNASYVCITRPGSVYQTCHQQYLTCAGVNCGYLAGM